MRDARGGRKPQRRRALGAPPAAAEPARAPPSVRPPPLPALALDPTSRKILWTCRAGFEAALYEELAWAEAHPRLLGPALLESESAPRVPPAFGRMGFKVQAVLRGDVERITAGVVEHLAPVRKPLHLQSWALDLESAAPLQGPAQEFGELLSLSLGADRVLSSPELTQSRGGALVQLLWLRPQCVALGLVSPNEAISLAPGGRNRMRREAASPSRAAMKLEEALDWLGLEPGRGETCVDLGAAPGGWTQRLVARGAKVVAVDPAKLLPELAQNRLVRHRQESAFAYAPEEPSDWLFCDMAWRPLEVAQLLGKWARNRWATHLVANIKLPMKDKNPILFRVRQTLEEAGWSEVRIRQLYHDRDEVTLTAHQTGRA